MIFFFHSPVLRFIEMAFKSFLDVPLDKTDIPYICGKGNKISDLDL